MAEYGFPDFDGKRPRNPIEKHLNNGKVAVNVDSQRTWLVFPKCWGALCGTVTMDASAP